jgi:hypothetical protein
MAIAQRGELFTALQAQAWCGHNGLSPVVRLNFLNFLRRALPPVAS